MVDVFAIELGKTNEFGNIAHYFRSRPQLEQLVLGLRRPIAVWAYIIPHKLKSFGEDETFPEAEGQTVGHAYLKLAFHVK